jgi:CRP-like cAMP-binding protein
VYFRSAAPTLPCVTVHTVKNFETTLHHRHEPEHVAMPLTDLACPAQAPASPNRLLGALPPDQYERIGALLETVKLGVGTVLHEVAQPIGYIYFPQDCVVSLLALAEGRMTLEVGLVGCEGMLGSAVALGHDKAQMRAVVQRGGLASRADSGAFRREFARNRALQRVLYRYTDTLLAQAIQLAVCSRFHVLEARLARSLLFTRDRLQCDRFHLTHEFLARALGVRRVGVTKAASALQQQGLIIYSRGNIEIVDVAGLAGASCACYQIVTDGADAALSCAFQ